MINAQSLILKIAPTAIFAMVVIKSQPATSATITTDNFDSLTNVVNNTTPSDSLKIFSNIGLSGQLSEFNSQTSVVGKNYILSNGGPFEDLFMNSISVSFNNLINANDLLSMGNEGASSTGDGGLVINSSAATVNGILFPEAGMSNILEATTGAMAASMATTIAMASATALSSATVALTPAPAATVQNSVKGTVASLPTGTPATPIKAGLAVTAALAEAVASVVTPTWVVKAAAVAVTTVAATSTELVAEGATAGITTQVALTATPVEDVNATTVATTASVETVADAIFKNSGSLTLSDNFLLDNSATGSLFGQTDAIVSLDSGGVLFVNTDAMTATSPLQSVPEPDFTLSGLTVLGALLLQQYSATGVKHESR